MKDKRVSIIIGHYGSGKTAFTLNYAIKCQELGEKVLIGDMDIVNPYYRSRECSDILKEKGIEILGTNIRGDAMDLPALSGDFMKGITDKSYKCIIDLGGNAVGSLAFSTFSKKIEKEECDVFFVLNANRPETSTLEDLIYYLRSIESVINLKVTGIINNTHLVRETTMEDLKRGDKLAIELSEKTGIPIKYYSYVREIVEIDKTEIKGEKFPMMMLNRQSWI